MEATSSGNVGGECRGNGSLVVGSQNANTSSTIEDQDKLEKICVPFPNSRRDWELHQNKTCFDMALKQGDAAAGIRWILSFPRRQDLMQVVVGQAKTRTPLRSLPVASSPRERKLKKSPLGQREFESRTPAPARPAA